MNDAVKDALQRFYDIAERDGMAVVKTNDGYVFMFKRERLSNMLFGSISPAFPLSIKTPEGIVQVMMDRNKLQAEVDAQPDQSLIMIVYTDKPIPS